MPFSVSALTTASYSAGTVSMVTLCTPSAGGSASTMVTATCDHVGTFPSRSPM